MAVLSTDLAMRDPVKAREEQQPFAWVKPRNAACKR